MKHIWFVLLHGVLYIYIIYICKFYKAQKYLWKAIVTYYNRGTFTLNRIPYNRTTIDFRGMQVYSKYIHSTNKTRTTHGKQKISLPTGRKSATKYQKQNDRQKNWWSVCNTCTITEWGKLHTHTSVDCLQKHTTWYVVSKRPVPKGSVIQNFHLTVQDSSIESSGGPIKISKIWSPSNLRDYIHVDANRSLSNEMPSSILT